MPCFQFSSLLYGFRDQCTFHKAGPVSGPYDGCVHFEPVWLRRNQRRWEQCRPKVRLEIVLLVTTQNITHVFQTFFIQYTFFTSCTFLDIIQKSFQVYHFRHKSYFRDTKIYLMLSLVKAPCNYQYSSSSSSGEKGALRLNIFHSFSSTLQSLHSTMFYLVCVVPVCVTALQMLAWRPFSIRDSHTLGSVAQPDPHNKANVPWA